MGYAGRRRQEFWSGGKNLVTMVIDGIIYQDKLGNWKGVRAKPSRWTETKNTIKRKSGIL